MFLTCHVGTFKKSCQMGSLCHVGCVWGKNPRASPRERGHRLCFPDPARRQHWGPASPHTPPSESRHLHCGRRHPELCRSRTHSRNRLWGSAGVLCPLRAPWPRAQQNCPPPPQLQEMVEAGRQARGGSTPVSVLVPEHQFCPWPQQREPRHCQRQLDPIG